MDTSKFIKNADGSVDVELTLERFRSDLESWVKEHEEFEERVGALVDDVLENAGKDVKVPFNALVGLTMAGLSPETELYSGVQKKVGEFIKDNTNKPREFSKRYCCTKGKNGGYFQCTGEVPSDML